MQQSSKDIFTTIQHEIDTNDVVLFMKGTARNPRCGFSHTVAQILDKIGVKFKDIDVLQREELRQGIKEFTNWPTIPQLYVKGEFIGGCDIVKEMYISGELAELLRARGIIQDIHH